MNTLFLNDIDSNMLLTVLIIVAVLAVVFAVLIVTVSKLCAVKEDERIGKITEKLANANCGGCGFNGCADFAKALLEGKADVSACGPTPNENKKEITEILGVPYQEKEQAYAVVHCAGGKSAVDKFEYVGNQGCAYENSFMGGRKACKNGCMGEGTCQNVCPYHAIKITDGVSYVDKSLCEACGLCVKNCPKKLVELIPKSSKVYVACSSNCKGKDVMNACKVGCIGCGLCEKNCPENAITMVDNIPVIDYSKCSGCLTCVDKCPRKTIRKI